MKTISVIGLGYVGLPSAAVFADSGLNVIGVDIDKEAVASINEGRAHIVEPGFDDLLVKVVGNGNLRATTTPEKAEVFVIAVPTPFFEDRSPDLRYVKSAAEAIAPLLEKGNLVILESTSPVGATEQMTGWLSALRPDLTFPVLDGETADIHIAYCPERILPGKVIEEVVSNDRVVGGMTPACSALAVEFYGHAVKGKCHVTNARTAEMCKLTENSFRDVNIAFANELSLICDRLGISVWELIALANHHPRVNILQPGPGVGGHCIAVDPWFIVHSAPEQAQIIRTAREVNDGKPGYVVERVREAVLEFCGSNPGKTPEDTTIACYGLAFKPDIDDLRESPAMEVVKAILDMHPGAVQVVEPHITELPARLSSAQFVSPETAMQSADVHVLLVDHSTFRSMQPTRGIIVDTRGLWVR